MGVPCPPSSVPSAKKGVAGYGGGDGAVFFISKNLPLKGKFFEMVSWGDLGGLAPPGISVTRALPPGGSGGLGPLRNLR